MTGRTISHYRILEKLGEGGMGVVYQGRDEQLGRLVAIKMLAASATANPERKRRFIQEARAASALNHPNIVTIHEISSADGSDFMVMEYVAGRTLEQLIGRKGLRVSEALKCAVQIADAVSAAHAAGIVHRDLKPGNVMVTEQGLVKVLDFGLAKLTERGDSGALVATETVRIEAAPHTEEGTILGTVAYMSPEQAEARKLDARSDIFSYGAVLYEMLTGRVAFQGNSKLSTLSAILKEDPKPVSALAAGVPRDLERIVGRCLRKDPERRFQNMADVKVALIEVKDEFETGAQPAAAVRAAPRRPWLAVASALLVAAVGVGAFLLGRRQSVVPAPSPVFSRLTADAGLTFDPALSPDGKLLAYASDRAGEGNLDIWVQQIAGGQPIRLTRHPADDREPSFSPDGSQIVFRSQRDRGGLYLIPTLGGDERLLAKGGNSPQFSSDGKWIAYWTGQFLAATTIQIVPASGGPARQLATGVPTSAYPAWSLDGKRVLFYGNMDPTDANAATADWWVVPVEGGQAVKTGALSIPRSERVAVLRGRQLWAPGRIVFTGFAATTGLLLELPISDSGEIHGPLRRLAGVPGARLQPAVSAGGRIVFATVFANSDLWSLPVDASSGRVRGELQRLTEDAAEDASPSLSADGAKMVFASRRSGNWDIWTRDMRTGKDRPLVVTPAAELRARITPDGSKVAYEEQQGQNYSIYAVDAGGGAPEKLCDVCRLLDWSPDGRRVLFWSGQPIRFSSADVTTKQITEMLSDSQYSLHRGQYSPDGKWLAFHVPSFNGKRSPMFITPLRDGKGGGRNAWIPITEGTAMDNLPWWSPDGSTLYFASDRDGFACFWGQRLDAAKRPTGPLFALYHLHGARRSLAQAGYIGPSMTRDRLVWSMTEATGNIWLAEPETAAR